MPPRSPLDQLPQQVQAELDRRLQDSGFGNLAELRDWLTATMKATNPDWSTSTSALGRYSKRFKDICDEARRTRQMMSRLVHEVGADELDEAGQALGILAKEEAFKLFLALREQGIDPESINFPKLLDSVTGLIKVSTVQNKWLSDQRAKDQAKLQELKASNRLDPETLRVVFEEVYGITS